MTEMVELSWTIQVADQLALLNAGKPLEAFERFYADDVVMYDNDRLFAGNKEEGRRKQEAYIKAAASISGRVSLIKENQLHETCLLHNRSSYVLEDGSEVQINGIHRQVWHNGQIREEYYYSGDQAARLLAENLSRL